MAPGKSRTRHVLVKDTSKTVINRNKLSSKIALKVGNNSILDDSILESMKPNRGERHDVKSVPYPSSHTALKILFSASLCSAVWTGISDCDETYNYWEPTHFLIYGNGFQTWEYSPVYALRSYLYLWPQALIGKICLHVFQLNKISTFYTIRFAFGIVSALCQLYFYRGICVKFGGHVGRLTLVFLVFATGMFISSTAYLPSTFAMYTTMIAFGAWFQDKAQITILAVALGALLGWPFAALTGVPVAIYMIFWERKVKYFVIWSIISLLLILSPLIIVDSFYYGRLVIAPFNILTYNVFSQHGPDIYGVEPWTFYFLNCFLNFNFVFILAFVSAPFVFLYCLGPKSSTYLQACVVSLSSMYLWMLVFFTRPHKEERFMFPIYPLICLSAAIMLNCVKKCITQVWKHKTCSKVIDYFTIAFLVMFSLISMSRSVILYKGYRAPVEVFLEVNSLFQEKSIELKSQTLCVGKEWHRFPSNFFLPDGWQLCFLKSEFKGQLPQPYSKGEKATSMIPQHMNEMNLEEASRYYEVDRCNFLLDSNFPHDTDLEPQYAAQMERWEKLVSVPFLHTEKSSKLFRSFYVPYFTETKCSFVDYNILRDVRNH